MEFYYSKVLYNVRQVKVRIFPGTEPYGLKSLVSVGMGGWQEKGGHWRPMGEVSEQSASWVEVHQGSAGAI